MYIYIYIYISYNNTYHSAIKIKRVDIKSSTYIDFDKKNNKMILNQD